MPKTPHRPENCQCASCKGYIGRYEKARFLVKQSGDVDWYHIHCQIERADAINGKHTGVTPNGNY